MSTGRFSKARLGRMHEVMAGPVERGEVAVFVTLLSRRGEVHVDAIGTTAVEGREPLGMKDRGFSVPGAKLDRLAPSYWPNAETGALDLHDGVKDSQWRRPPAFPDGGAGLVSTVDDYLAFGQMMLNKGQHGRERILSRLSVETITTDQLTPEQKAASDFFPGFWESRGWGFGVSIVTRRDDVAAVPGRLGWDGGYGTSWSSDPKEGMVAILMTQRAAFPPRFGDLSRFLDLGLSGDRRLSGRKA